MSSYADSGFGSGLREQIQLRHLAAPRRPRLIAVNEETGNGNRGAEDLPAGDWFSTAGSTASAEEKSREDQAAELRTRLDQVRGDLAAAKAELADRDERIAGLQRLLETTYRQRDDTSETLD